MADPGLRWKVAKLNRVLIPFSNVLASTSQRGPRNPDLELFVTRMKPYIVSIQDLSIQIDTNAATLLSNRTRENDFRETIDRVWSQINDHLPENAFEEFRTAETRPVAEAFHRAVFKNRISTAGRLISQDGLSSQRLSVNIPSGSRGEMLTRFREYNECLKNLLTPQPAHIPDELSSDNIQDLLTMIRPLFETLLEGLTGAMTCDCLFDHGVLLFLESHLKGKRGRVLEGLRFRLAISTHSPYVQYPRWRECDVDVSVLCPAATEEERSSLNSVCDHVQDGDIDGYTPFILALKDCGFVHIDWRDSPNNFHSAGRLRLSHILNHPPDLPSADRLALCLLFAFCTFYMMESQIFPQKISKDNIYFLQTDQHLILQPFLFYDFGPRADADNNDNTYDYEADQERRLKAKFAPLYKGLALLILEIFKMRCFENGDGNARSAILTVNKEIQTWADNDKKLKTALQNCLLGPPRGMSWEDFFRDKILPHLIEEYRDHAQSSNNNDIQEIALSWDNFDASFVTRLVSPLPLDQFILKQIPAFDTRPAKVNSCQHLYKEMKKIHEKLTTMKYYKSVKVAVLDTGVEQTNSDFGPDGKYHGRVVKSVNFIDPKDKTVEEPGVDVQSHGTFVAGIIAKMTKHTELYVGKVCNGWTGFYDTESINALEKGILEACSWNVDIINLSLGFKLYDHKTLVGVKAAIKKAHKKGIIVVAAPGNGRFDEKVAWPADSDLVLCANSLDGNGKPSIRNPRTKSPNDLYINGEGHCSSDIGGGECLKSGSSFSTAALSAVCATILEFMNAAVLEDSCDKEVNLDAAAKLRGHGGMARVLRHIASEAWTTEAWTKDDLNVCHVKLDRLFKPGLSEHWKTIARAVIVNELFDQDLPMRFLV